VLRRRPAHALLLGGVAAALALAATLAPTSSAATTPQAVKGGITQAYQATYYVKPAPLVIPAVRLYLAGSAQDQPNKVAGSPSATFSRTAPNGSSEVVQTTAPFGASQSASDNPTSAFWTGSYSGVVDGTMTFHWYWTSADATAGADNLTIRVYADPGTAKQKLLGSGYGSVLSTGSTSRLFTSTLAVKGTIASTLRVLAQPRYVNSAPDMRVSYGSATTPSYVDVPTGGTPAVKLPTTTAVHDLNPLVVSATKIGRKAAEPTLGVTKEGNAFITAADFDGLSPATPRTLIYGSTDGNKTWHNVSPLIAGQPTPPTTADPYLYIDPDTGRVFNDDLTAACSFLQWSDDQGKTWSNGNPLACESPVDDHQTVVTGKPVAGLTTTGYPKIVYYCVNKVADVSCARSVDGGATFTYTGNPAYMGLDQGADGSPSEGTTTLCGGLHGHIITDPAGRLYVPKGHCSQPWVAISDDAGSTWTQVRVSSMLVASHQTSIAADTAGNLYYVWFGAADLLPYLSVSRDHGRHWGPAKLIAPPGVAAVNFPSIDAGAPGHLAVSFPGSTARAEDAARPWDYFVAVTTNALDALPVFHSTTANLPADPIHRGPCLDRCDGMYDFIDVVISPKSNELWAAGVDTCTSAACIAAPGPTLTSAQAASDAQGFVVRELAGPGVTKGVATAPVSARPGVVRTAPRAGAGLAATGLGGTMPAIGALVVLIAVVLRRRAASQ
jgi:hypothetical protein